MFLNPVFKISCLIFFVAVCSVNQYVLAQGKPGVSVKTSVDRNRITLGEPFVMELKLQYPEKTGLTKIPVMPDSLQHFDVLEEMKVDTAVNSGLIIITKRYRMTSFDSGHWAIPAFTVSAGKLISKSDTLGIDVMTVPLEGNSYNDIREIIEVDAEPFDWKRMVAIGITVLVVLLGLWYFLKNRKKPKPLPAEFDSKLSPLEQALQSLKKLREENAMEKGEAKKFYSGIYDTLRVYLLRQHKLPVMSSTTSDVLLKLKGDYLDTDELAGLAAVLRIADAVKFAKYPSSSGEASASIDRVEKIIRNLNQLKN
jgi:hypothetical protein